MKREPKITIEVSHQMLRWIRKLHKTGLYGLTLEETVRRMLEKDLWERLHDKDSLLRLPLPRKPRSRKA